MSDINYLNRLFKSYYKENQVKIPLIKLFDQREFGFIPWDKQTWMLRHMSFTSREILIQHMILNGPRHVYASGTLYQQPENQDMEKKGYKGCDLIIDIDVDHFYTPCKKNHDYWYCKECGENGKGMIKTCPKCKKLKIKSLHWICEECLSIAKKEIIKLIYDFLIPDFNIGFNNMSLVFSGHRGYHLKIEEERIRKLSSDERREIADYLTGENISFEVLGLQVKGGIIFGFSRDSIGWVQKIFRKIEEILNKPNNEIRDILSNNPNFNFNQNLINSLLNFKNDFLNVIQNNQRNIWAIEGFGINKWNSFLKGIVHEIGVEIDIPVVVDIHRLIRYPGSLHGKTGFKVQELNPNDLDDYNPLDEQIKKLDPIVFVSKLQTIQKLEIIESNVPATKIKGETFGPYKLGDKIEVPHHIAVFLLCKGVAKSI